MKRSFSLPRGQFRIHHRQNGLTIHKLSTCKKYFAAAVHMFTVRQPTNTTFKKGYENSLQTPTQKELCKSSSGSSLFYGKQRHLDVSPARSIDTWHAESLSRTVFTRDLTKSTVDKRPQSRSFNHLPNQSLSSRAKRPKLGSVALAWALRYGNGCTK